MNRRTLLLTASAIAAVTLLSGCEMYNKAKRGAVTLAGGNFKVTFAEGNFQRSWVVEGGKVTSNKAAGYYFFWATVNGKSKYVQVPVDRTIIEEK